MGVIKCLIALSFKTSRNPFVQKRNRDFEYNIKLEYLKNLNTHYERWTSNYQHGRLLVIDINKTDFVEKVEDFSTIVGRIELELNNLFSNQAAP